MPRHTPATTPLLALLRALTPDQREEFVALTSTSVNYLYGLAGCARRSCRTTLAKEIADASVAMHKKYGTPVVTFDQLATMCQGC